MADLVTDINPAAQLGKHVKVGSFTVIEEDVVIGDHTTIGPHVTILSGTRIGKHCQIFPGAVIGAIPQDLKFKGEKTTVSIGDHTIVREYATINRGTSATTIVGNNVLLMAYSHVAHDCIIEDRAVLVNSAQIGGHAHIGYHAVLGARVTVHQFIAIGDKG